MQAATLSRAPEATDERRRRVAIFRMRLFLPSETFVTTEARNLERYQPCFVGFDEAKAPDLDCPVLLARGPMPKPATIAGFSYPFAGLGALAPDVIHAHFAVDGLFATPIASRLGLPLLVTLHGYDVQISDAAFLKSGKVAQIAAVVRRGALGRRASRFLCVSEAIRRRAVEKGFPEEKLAIHYLGVDTSALQESQVAEPGLIVQVGRLVEKKGTDYLIRALQILKARGVAARVVVVGGGDRLETLTALARSLGVDDLITFKGAVPHAETLDWMRRASVIAVPSVTAADGDAEGLPIVVLEAGALGKPVIGFASSGIPEAVETGHTGLLAPEREVEQLAASLEAALTDDDLRVRLGKAARAAIVAKFDIHVSARRLERFYDDAITDKPRGS